MARGQWLEWSHGWVQELLWHAINPWHHRCNIDSCVEAKGPSFYNWFLFFQIKGLPFNIQRQIVMDHWKRFWDVYVGISSSIDDAWVLKMSSLYHKTTKQNLFVVEFKQKGIRLYILGDKGYPYYCGWWCHINKQRYVKLCSKFSTMNSHFMANVWLKIPLQSLKKCWRNFYRRPT